MWQTVDDTRIKIMAKADINHLFSEDTSWGLVDGSCTFKSLNETYILLSQNHLYHET